MEKEQKNSAFAHVLIYFFTWLTGIILFVSKDDKRKKQLTSDFWIYRSGCMGCT
ncbi:MAG: hypothetical protein QXG73_03790 [Candidatus Micrarchaeaceae archaeon]